MKLVINDCYGGFGLSRTAIRAYLKRKGKEVYFYKQTKYNHNDGIDEFTKIFEPKKETIVYSFTKDLGETFTEWPKKDGSYFYDRNISRDDQDLVAVVEELGDKANGDCGKLKVVEIPDGIEWTIDEYDGIEHIAESHRTWS